MAVLQLEVSDKLVSKIGLETLYRKMQQLLELQEIRLLALEVSEQLRKDGLDHDTLFKESKQKAWQQFKAQRLNSVLP
jgi:hypothetical protein